MSIEPQILIVELGGQLTQNIGRILRNTLRVRPVILPPDKVEEYLKSHEVRGIILSGSGHSINDPDSPKPPESIFEARYAGERVPILGICYGMQYLAWRFGGQVERVEENHEYGPSTIELLTTTALFEGTWVTQEVWASHGDSVVRLGQGFEVIAKTLSGGIGAIMNILWKIWAVQFHPEATQTEFGEKILSNFVLGICGCTPNWDEGSIVDYLRGLIQEAVSDSKVVIPFSGGVDSSVAAAIATPVLKNCRGFTVDGDHLRHREDIEIEAHAQFCQLPWQMLDRKEQFVSLVSQSTNGTLKRNYFQDGYVGCIREFTLDYDPDPKASLILQGTLAPDIIESGETGAHRIVGHHNTGLELRMPEFRFLHPLSELFKHEVREIAQALGLPESIWRRHPFPGPGLFLRLLGFPVTHELLELVRWLDYRATAIMKQHNVYYEFSQLVVAFGNLLAYGVRGDEKSEGHLALVRPFKTKDFMTGYAYIAPADVMQELARELGKDKRVGRVVYDISPKPFGRTEYE